MNNLHDYIKSPKDRSDEDWVKCVGGHVLFLNIMFEEMSHARAIHIWFTYHLLTNGLHLNSPHFIIDSLLSYNKCPADIIYHVFDHYQPLEMHETILYSIIRSNHDHILDHFIQYYYPTVTFSQQMTLHATWFGTWNTLKWLVQHGCPIDPHQCYNHSGRHTQLRQIFKELNIPFTTSRYRPK